jgi:hypothetical protein
MFIMKRFQQNSKRWIGAVGLMGLLTVLLSSCLKDKNNYTTPPTALLSVTNASPDAQPLNIVLDNNLVNNYPVAYGLGLDYFSAYTGKRTVSFYSSSTQQKIASDTITLKDNVVYSLFLANSISKPDLVLITDSLKNPAADKATIRFINVSANAPAADLAITEGAVLVANKPYKGYSSFEPVAGNASYSLEVRQAGTGTVLATVPKVTLQTGSVYTVWLHGDATSTNDATKLRADIIRNAVY